jgi:hypothetical protein
VETHSRGPSGSPERSGRRLQVATRAALLPRRSAVRTAASLPVRPTARCSKCGLQNKRERNHALASSPRVGTRHMTAATPRGSNASPAPAVRPARTPPPRRGSSRTTAPDRAGNGSGNRTNPGRGRDRGVQSPTGVGGGGDGGWVRTAGSLGLREGKGG